MVRTFLYMAMVHNMSVAQADVKTAFLNGKGSLPSNRLGLV